MNAHSNPLFGAPISSSKPYFGATRIRDWLFLRKTLLTRIRNVIYFTSCRASALPSIFDQVTRDVKLDQVLTALNGKVISKEVDLDLQVEMACGADLMSDVLTFTHSGTLLLTGLTNPQVVRTADMAGIRAIVFVRGKYPPPETIALAEQMNIPLLASRFTMYESCGRLFAMDLPSCGLFALSQ